MSPAGFNLGVLIVLSALTWITLSLSAVVCKSITQTQVNEYTLQERHNWMIVCLSPCTHGEVGEYYSLLHSIRINTFTLNGLYEVMYVVECSLSHWPKTLPYLSNVHEEKLQKKI